MKNLKQSQRLRQLRIQRKKDQLSFLAINQFKVASQSYRLNHGNNNIVDPEPVLEDDVLHALKSTKPSPGIAKDKYEKWESEFGSF